ncbi:unnamed protein product [Lepeophtheirus salmonis]|uniref:(salmon louse) hypothetical protein n=1 Tax=Lepeophtheirus salmonis TaxID=72036 RepID=A0A7R8DAS5_LEPSM|nr:unnamed protein product [Lepeophtheirus salmonis]CAF3028534.1 unnamed protein product [Lepeophtheirus salmonis]
MVCLSPSSSSKISPKSSSGIISSPIRNRKVNGSKRVLVEREFTALKSLLPSLATDSSASPLEVVLEAITYIQSLESRLVGESSDASDLKSSFLSVYGKA